MVLKLNPWPFGNQTAKLHWLGNVKQTKRNNWKITVAFECNHEVQLIEYPVGLLPILRLGVHYKNGKPLSNHTEGSIIIKEFDDYSVGKTINALEACRTLNYYLYGKAELINQNILHLVQNGINYYIPYSELIRSFFAKSKTITNAMFRPNGLVYLVENVYQSGDFAQIAFDNQVPARLLSKSFLNHFSWIYFEKVIRSSFNSIYNYLINEKLDKGHFKYGASLICDLPTILHSTWIFRGMKQGNHILIFELKSFSGAELSIKEIHYAHHSIKKRVYTGNPKKRMIADQRQEEFEVDGTKNHLANQDINQPVVDQSNTQMSFVTKTMFKKMAIEEQTINQGDTYYRGEGPGGALQEDGSRKVSVNDPVAGGNLPPIEFTTLEVVSNIKGFALEQFLRMIQRFEELNPEYKVFVNIVYLPLGRKFSWIPDGRRRACALVKVLRPGMRPIWILEIARPDNKALSTLLFTLASTDFLLEEKEINKILQSIVFNSGHWDKYKLSHYNYFLMKHTSTYSERWAIRVKERLSAVISV